MSNYFASCTLIPSAGKISQDCNALDSRIKYVTGFVDPVKALQHFENGGDTFHIVISDVRMPKISGFQLARRIKELRPELRVILISAFEINKSEFDKVMPSTKVDGFLCKPFSISQLLEAIKTSDPAKQAILH